MSDFEIAIHPRKLARLCKIPNDEFPMFYRRFFTGDPLRDGHEEVDEIGMTLMFLSKFLRERFNILTGVLKALLDGMREALRNYDETEQLYVAVYINKGKKIKAFIKLVEVTGKRAKELAQKRFGIHSRDRGQLYIFNISKGLRLWVMAPSDGYNMEDYFRRIEVK